MADMLTTRANGFVEMAYLGEVGWHGKGQELTEDEARNIDERALQKAGMDWLVKRSRVRFGEGENQQVWDKHHVLFRSDTKAPLGIVGEGYQILQPRGCLEFMAELANIGGFKLETAGTMFGGQRFWALASIQEGAPVLDADMVKGYLLIATSVDGTMATTVDPTTVRVVCNNTLSMALAQGSKARIKVNHRSELTAAKRASIRDQLGIVSHGFHDFIEASRKLAQHPVSNMRAQEMTEKLLVETKTVTKEDPRTSAGYRSIMSLFQHGEGNKGQTAWDWVNGVTEYVDHVQRAKTESHRMANSLFGKGDALKTEAFERALALVA